MDNRLHILVAGDQQETIPPALWRTIADCGFVERRGVSAVGFCRALDGSLIVVLPKAFSEPSIKARLKTDDPFRSEHVFRLIRVFRKILYETEFSQEYIDSTTAKAFPLPAVDPVLECLEAAIRLRADFRKNGLCIPKGRSRVANAQNHPVDWSVTIRRTAPLIEQNSVLFVDTVHHRRLKDPTDLFFLIHAHALREILTLTGEKHLTAELPILEGQYLQPFLRNPRRYFRAFHHEIFSDRGRTLLAYLEAYFGAGILALKSQRLKDDALSYTASFETLWEFVLAGLFGADANASFRLPQGHWVSWPSTHRAGGIEPKADLVLERPAFSILDAKDYRIINGTRLLDARLGNSDDHYKQVIYRALLQNNTNSPLVNILAFPTIAQNQIFQLRGCHYWQNLPASPVFEISVDYDLAIKCWLGEATIDVATAFKHLLSDIFSLSISIKTTQPALFL